MRSQKIYLSSRFARRDELREYRSDIHAAGLGRVTSSWLDSTSSIGPKGQAIDGDGTEPESDEQRAARFADQDLKDVIVSDVLIAFTEGKADAIPGGNRGGRHVEFGVALGLAMRILVVGPREHVFHSHERVVVVPTWDQALTVLREWSQA